jgi:hypothetical protein
VNACGALYRKSANERAANDEAAKNVRALVRTGDRSWADGKAVPFPSGQADEFVRYASDPYLRSILPAAVRAPLDLEPATVDPAFSTNGAPENVPREPADRAWGSWHADNTPATGLFRSQPMKPPASPYLRFQVVGTPEIDNVVIRLVSFDGRTLSEMRPRSANAWLDVTVPSPKAAFTVVAEDRASQPGAWVAFRPPVELTCLSRVAEFSCAAGLPTMCLGALGIAVAALLRGRPRATT